MNTPLSLYLNPSKMASKLGLIGRKKSKEICDKAQNVADDVKTNAKDLNSNVAKQGKEALANFASGASKVFTKTNSKQKLKKSADIACENQEEIEEASSLACPGGGLVAHIVISAVSNGKK